MQMKSFIPAAGLLVSSTNAILLPPEVSTEDIVNTLPVPFKTQFSAPVIAADRLELECPGCPVRVGSAAKITTDVESHLELDFSIKSDNGVDRLMLNDFELYPKANPLQNTLTAALVPSSSDENAAPEVHETLGYALGEHKIETAEDDALNLIMVDLQIIQINDVFVDGIPKVEIKLVQTAEGNLLIGNVETMASETRPAAPSLEKPEECSTILCKWRALLKQGLAKLKSGKPCGHHRPAGHRPISQTPSVPEEHSQGYPQEKTEELEHGYPMDQFKHQHENKHGWLQLFKSIASHILLPIGIGIMAGVIASVLGMLVGTAIVFVWRTFVRRPSTRRHRSGRGRGRSFKAAQDEAAYSDEKVGLMAALEEPTPPAYIEDGLEVSEDKKPEDDA